MRKKINILLSGLIALISGCSMQNKVAKSNEVVALYGVPYATYEVSGKVTNSKNSPIEGAKVLVKGYKNQVIGDTIVTNKKGEFVLYKSAFPTETINIVVFEPDNQVPTDSVQHETHYEKQQSERAFYRGECKIETEIKVK
jgi:putative lipoprotein (rSAM/lipoprotein system)